MDELVRWLHEQLDKDERIAREALCYVDADWCWDREENVVLASGLTAAGERPGAITADRWRRPLVESPAVVEHVAEWDPARVLREVDAKRRLLDLHAVVYRNVCWVGGDGGEETDEIPVCGHCVPRHSGFPHRSAVPEGPCATIRLLALPYADRPGYREEWRP